MGFAIALPILPRYTLTGANASLVYQLEIDDAIRADIQNALNAGKTVTAHERPISVSGWSGTGYIIADPATGAGAFKISGGANGSHILIGALGLFAVAGIAFAGAAAGWFALPYLAFLALSIAFHLFILSLIVGFDDADWKIFTTQAGVIASIFLGVLARALALIIGGPTIGPLMTIVSIISGLLFFLAKSFLVFNDASERRRGVVTV